MRGGGGRDEPRLPRLLGGAAGVRPAEGAPALQLRRLQRQVPPPLPLQGLPQGPGGAVPGLLMMRPPPRPQTPRPRLPLQAPSTHQLSRVCPARREEGRRCRGLSGFLVVCRQPGWQRWSQVKRALPVTSFPFNKRVRSTRKWNNHKRNIEPSPCVTLL